MTEKDYKKEQRDILNQLKQPEYYEEEIDLDLKLQKFVCPEK